MKYLVDTLLSGIANTLTDGKIETGKCEVYPELKRRLALSRRRKPNYLHNWFVREKGML